MHVDQPMRYVNYIFHYISISSVISKRFAVDFSDCLGKETALSQLIELHFLEEIT